MYIFAVVGYKPPDKKPPDRKPPNWFTLRGRPPFALLTTGGRQTSSHAYGFRFNGK